MAESQQLLDRPQAAAQPMRALERANEIRSAHAQLLEQIRTRPKGRTLQRTERRRQGALRAAEILERGGTGATGRLRVDLVLEAVPLLGPTKADRLIKAVGVRSARKRLEELTERQRQELAAALRDFAGICPADADPTSDRQER